MRTSELRIEVQIDDLDHSGHVAHARWVSFLERGRIHLLSGLGLDLRDFLNRGIQIVASDLDVSFGRAATLGDKLTVHTRVQNVSSDRVSIAASIVLGTRQDAPTCLEAVARLAFVGDEGTALPIPQELLATLDL